MAIDLNQTFELLGNEVIAQVVSVHHDRAREEYPLEITVRSFEDLKEELILYYQWHFSRTIGNGAEIAPEAAWEYCRNIIESYFRRRRGGELNGLEAAYRMVRQGTDGGLRLLINLIADSLKRSQEEQYVEHVIDSNIDPMDFESHINLMREYIRRYSDYLPPDMRVKRPELLARDYKQLIKIHCEVLNRIRSNIGVY